MKSNIKKLITKINMTVTELSDKTGIGRTTLSKLVNSNELPASTKVGTLLAISSALGVGVSALFEGERNKYSVFRKVPFSKNNVDQKGYLGGYWVVSKNESEKKLSLIRITSEMGGTDTSDPLPYLWMISQLSDFLSKPEFNFFADNENIIKLSKVADVIKKAKSFQELFDIFNLKKAVKGVTKLSDNFTKESLAGYELVEKVFKIIRPTTDVHLWTMLQSFFVSAVVNEEEMVFNDVLKSKEPFIGEVRINITAILPQEVSMLAMLNKDINTETALTKLINNNCLLEPDIDDFSEKQCAFFVKDISTDLKKAFSVKNANVYFYSTPRIVPKRRLLGICTIDGGTIENGFFGQQDDFSELLLQIKK